MNTREIEYLLEKYDEGLTDLQEEEILRAFFNKDEVPDHLKSYQAIFIYTHRAKLENIPHHFERKLNEILAADTKKTPQIRPFSRSNRFFFITSIAAGFFLLIAIFFTVQNDIFRKNGSDSPHSSQEEAFLDEQKALLIVSANFNTGIQQVERFQMLDKAWKNAQLLNKFYQYQTIIINPDLYQKQSIKPKLP